MASPSGQSANGTTNRDAYRQSFLRNIHRLLELGYQSLVVKSYTNAEEDDITGDICKRMKELTEENPTEKWMAHFSIHDQDPLNDRLHPDTGKVRRGKRRPRLDIRLMNNKSMPKPRFCVEAKRLYSSNSVSGYMDDEGLGAFISGYYADKDDAAGMLGYVQADSVTEWLPKLRKKLLSDTGLQPQAKGELWPSFQFKGGPANTYLSLHKRVEKMPDLEVYHTFFVFG